MKKYRSVVAAGMIAVLGVLAQAGSSAATDGRTEILLSGDEWRLGSFAMGAGETQKVYAPDFKERDFRSVPVPAEIQTTFGLKGMELYRYGKETSLVNKKEWWYRKSFPAPRKLEGKSVRLVFDGVDYFASVWLNGEKLGDHDGCYTRFSYDITSKIKPGQANLLAVKVTCPWMPKDRSLVEYQKGSFALVWKQLMGSACFDRLPNAGTFGWPGIPAAGNAVLTLGIIRDVKLQITPRCRVESLHAYTKALNADGSATVVVMGEAFNDGPADATRTLALQLRPDNFTGAPQVLPSQALTLRPGRNVFNVEASVPHAKLWWSWDMGAQNLYRLGASLEAPVPADTDHAEIRFGIRTVERKADLGYKLNGKQFFAKSVWYPMASYYSALNTRTLYAKDLWLLRHANANMIVNHTVVERADFYDLCDEIGLLIEMQMPFSQAGPIRAENTPRYEPYRAAVLEHMQNIIRQVRNHPSVMTLVPYAEFISSKKTKEDLDPEFRKIAWEEAPGNVYWWSFCDGGEGHLWSATAGYTRKDDYRPNFDISPGARFISEYGTCAMSSYESMQQWLTPDEIWSDKNPRTPFWFHLPIDHNAQTYLSSFSWDGGLNSLLWWATQIVDQDVRSAKELVEASQLYQMFKAQYGFGYFRCSKYKSIQGVRWWAYKDPAPGHQWGFLDAEQVPKMGYYGYKRACAPLAVQLAYRDELYPTHAGNKVKFPIFVVSDLRTNISVEVQCDVTDLKGKPVWSRSFSADLAEDESKQVGEMDCVIPDSPTMELYMMRATVRQRGGPVQHTMTKYVKALPKDESMAHAVPKLGKRCRILLIANNFVGGGTYDKTQPVHGLAENLKGLGAEVDEISVIDPVDRFPELLDGEALHKKYEVIWLASYEAVWKALDDNGEGIAKAVELGCGFVHSGGLSSFQGDSLYGSFLGLTKLADVLPVKLRQGDDMHVKELTRDIQVQEYGWNDCLLKKTGIEFFNMTDPKPGCPVVMKVNGKPLLATGRYGQGHTVALTCFPHEGAANVAWMSLYGQILMAAMGENPEYRYAFCVDVSKPELQMLKEQPRASVTLGAASVAVSIQDGAGRGAIAFTNGKRFARLMRVRVEWPSDAIEKSVLMLYSDNYVDLLPGETARIDMDVRYFGKMPRSVQGVLVIEGTNVPEQRIPIVLKRI